MMTIFFVVLSFSILAALIWIKKKHSDIAIDSSFVIISIIPLAVWILDSGKLTELSFGDFTIKLRSATSKPILPESQNNFFKKLTVIDFADASKNKLTFSDPHKEALAFTLGNPKYDNKEIILFLLDEKQNARLNLPNYIAFKDSEGKFKGLCFTYDVINEVKNQNDFANLMAGSDIFGFHNIMTASISKESDKKSSLKIMSDKNISELPVIDENNKLVGVLLLEPLMRSVLLDLILN